MNTDESNTTNKENDVTSSNKSGKKRERATFSDPLESSNALISDPKPVVDVTKGSPPSKKVTPLEDFMAANDAASKLVLMHEIALDEAFKLPDPDAVPNGNTNQTTEGKIQSAVKDAVHRAFWDSLASDFASNPPVLDHAFVLLAEIKESLTSLLPNHQVTSLHKRINEGLDIDFLKQQAKHDALDIHSLTKFLVDTMAMMCAPVRDEQVNQLRSIDGVVDIFKGIYKTLDLMKRDFVNFTISSFRPLLQQHHIEYERKKFAEILAKLPNGLETTEKWIIECYEEMEENREVRLNQIAARGNSSLPPPPTPLTVLKRAFIKLLHWEAGKPFPETVLVDQNRLLELQVQLKRAILLASTLLITFSSLSPDLASHQAFVTNLKQDLLDLFQPSVLDKNHLSATLDGVGEQIIHKVSTYLKTVNNSSNLSTEQKRGFKEQISALRGLETNTVYRILLKRIHEYLFAMAEYFARRRPTASPSNTVTVPPGLQAVSTELTNIATSYAQLVNRNQTIYGPFYVPVLRKALDLPSTPSLSPMTSPRDPGPNTSDVNRAKKKLDMNMGQPDAVPSTSTEETEVPEP